MTTFKPVTKNGGPKCPNHGEFLEGLPHPIPNKGTGICPVSKCPFDYVIDLDAEDVTYEKDHLGNLKPVKTYKVSGDESQANNLKPF